MKFTRFLLDRMLGPRTLPLYLLALILVFQLMIITRLPFLYNVFKVLFVGLAVLLLASLVKAAAKDKVIILVILALILMRLPFLLHPTGLITMSDNALEAIQSQEIRDSHTAPFYQFEVLAHQGTLRYLIVAEIWDFVGTRYLVLTLWNLVVFGSIILLLARVFEPLVPRSVVILFSLLSFAFIETMFDFSMLLRGGIYLDALLLTLLGMSLFDFEFRRKGGAVLAFFFMGFAAYVQPISLLFSGSFVVVAAALALKRRNFWKTAGLALTGVLLGTIPLIYYRFFFHAKPQSPVPFERLSLVPLSSLSVRAAGGVVAHAWAAFVNLFRYELSYFLDTFKAGPTDRLLSAVNWAGCLVSLIVLAVGLVLALRKLAGLFRKRDGSGGTHWPYPFFVVLLLGVVAKFILLKPVRLEPRHNIDLLLLIVLAYFFVFGAVGRAKKLGTLPMAAAAFLLLIFTVPHYRVFLKNTVAKEASYQELMTTLSENKVRNLATDFNLAYPVYFLSGRTIQVSDTIGPLRQPEFFAGMRGRVDTLPDGEKSYLFCSEAAGNRPWHKAATRKLKSRIADRLTREGVDFRTVNLKDYVLFIPNKSEPQNLSPEALR